MKKYIAKRILLAIPMLFAISFIAFMLINIMPSDPAEVALRVNEIIPTEAAIESMRMELGLNDPFFVRYFNWLGDCLRLDFGVSYTNTTRKVFDEIVRCLPATIDLAIISLVIVIVVSIPVGVLCAVYKDSLFDRITEKLTALYGEAKTEKVKGSLYNYCSTEGEALNLGQVKYRNTWDSDELSVYLYLGKDNYEVSFGLLYESKNFEQPEEDSSIK